MRNRKRAVSRRGKNRRPRTRTQVRRKLRRPASKHRRPKVPPQRSRTPEALVQALKEARKSKPAAVKVLRTELTSARNRPAYVRSADAAVAWARDASQPERRIVIDSVLQDGEPGALYLVQRISEMKRSQARPFMQEYLRAGGSLTAVATWFRSAGQVLRKNRVKTRGTAGAVVDGIAGAAGWVIDTLEDGIDAILENLEALIDAIIAAGVKIADILKSITSWTLDNLVALFVALIEAGVAIGQMIVPMLKWAYKLVHKFVAALIAAGAKLADMLAETIGKSYWAFRRIASGILNVVGVGEYLDAILGFIGSAVDKMWSFALKGIRYTLKTLNDVVEWVVDKGFDVIEGVLRAWELAGEALEDFYSLAKRFGAAVWEKIAQATQIIRNSVQYVLDYIKEDVFPAIFSVVRGALRAGWAVASAIAWAIEQSFEITVEVVRAIVNTGVTLGRLITDTIRNPLSAFDNILRAVKEIGGTLIELYRAVIIETAQEYLEQVTHALKRIGELAADILHAVAEVALGAVGTVIAILMRTLASYRPLTAAEKADARTVFGSSIDYSMVGIAQESFLNDVIFGIQDFVTGNPESRAFVTNSLINYDVDEDLERHTLIHELTHVWQAQHTGAFYLTEAIHAQITEGYNYGYDEGLASVDIPIDYAGTMKLVDMGDATGEGAQDELIAAGGDFEEFNREQQGQIMMHYFVRKQLLGLSPSDYAAWQPYVNHVRAA